MAQYQYQQFTDDPFRIDYALVPHLMAAWRVPIRPSEDVWKRISSNPSLFIHGNLTPEENGKRPNDENDIVCVIKKKRVMSPVMDVDDVPVTSVQPPQEDAKPMILFTGVKMTKEIAVKVKQLGGCLVNNPSTCTHVVTSALLRTVKFLCAISHCKFVVTLKWILDSSVQNRFLDENLYAVTDTTNEEQYSCNLKQLLTVSDRSALFKGLKFYLTPGVFPCPSVLMDIISSAGGSVLNKRLPTKEILTVNQNEIKFIVITCDNDLHLCRDLLAKQLAVYNAEFILSGILRHEIDHCSYAYSPMPKR